MYWFETFFSTEIEQNGLKSPLVNVSFAPVLLIMENNSFAPVIFFNYIRFYRIRNKSLKTKTGLYYHTP